MFFNIVDQDSVKNSQNIRSEYHEDTLVKDHWHLRGAAVARNMSNIIKRCRSKLGCMSSAPVAMTNDFNYDKNFIFPTNIISGKIILTP